MAGWGMGHNLEKNLQRVQSFRERGQLDRALKQLQEWARKYPDTPHYLYEAAMVAFDLEDWSSGIHALRSLLRSLPDTREKVLSACHERFEHSPALPLAEFLVDCSLADGETTIALDLAEKLGDQDLAIYVRKTAMRHQSLVATGSTAPSALQSSHSLRLVLACAADQAGEADEAVEALLDIDAALAEKIEPLLTRAVHRYRDGGSWMLARARVKHVGGALAEAATLCAAAAMRVPTLLSSARSLAESIEPDGDQRGPWFCARGDLALIARDGNAAAQHYVEAADAMPRLRDDLIARIDQVSNDPTIEGRGALLKLRLRLLVVQKRFDDIPDLAQRLLREGLAEAQELRSLLGEGRADGLPSEMLVVMAETALRDGDLAAAAVHANEIASHDDVALQRLLRAVESLSDEWPDATRLQLDALRAVLLGRMKNREGANGTLVTMWEKHAGQVPTLLAVTEKCLDLVEPLPILLRASLGPALDAGLGDQMRPLLTRMLVRREDSADGDLFGATANPVFDQDALSLDFGATVGDDCTDDLTQAVLAVLEATPARGAGMLALLDSLDAEFDVARHHRHAVAVAALFAGDLPRALPELSVLVMMAEPELIERVGQQVDLAIELLGSRADLLVTRADLHADLGEIDEAAQRLSEALKADPSRAEDLTKRFEQLLAKSEEEGTGPLWQAFAEALFQAGRFDQLREVCGRAMAKLPADRVAPFLVLQARVMIVEGRSSDSLQLIQQHLVAGRLSADLAVGLLQEVLRSQPASAIAQLMLGQAATRADRIDLAIEAYLAAVRLDHSLLGPVSDQILKIMARPGASALHVMRVAGFFREAADAARAASAYEKALRLDPQIADRILGELGSALDDQDTTLDLVQVGAHAARCAGQVERACELLLRLDRREPARFELVLSELRQLRESHPDRLLPVLCIARVLLQHDAPEAAAQTVVDASEPQSYPLEDRVEMLLEFHRLDPKHAALTLALAARLGEQGALDAAVERIRSAMELTGFEAERAIDIVSALIEHDGEHPALRLLQHDLLVRAGRVDEALRCLPDPASLGEWQQSEISERLAEYPARVEASVDLSLVLMRSLRVQGRTEDAIAVLRRAGERTGAAPDDALWTELARLLHESGLEAESRRILLRSATDDAARRRAYQLYGSWTTERTTSELRALRERHHARPQAAHIALQLAEKLLDAGLPEQVPAVLHQQAPEGEWRVRRAVLLGRAYLATDRADRAEAVLLDARPHVTDDVYSRELAYRLAECAQRLGRPAVAAASLAGLLDAPDFHTRAGRLARRSYQQYLEDVSGDYRAVLTRVSTLSPTVEETP